MKPRPIRPDQVSATCREKFWFDCDVCDREFKMSPFNITIRNLWCPFCFLERNKEFISKIRDLARVEKLEMVINPDFDWAPECIYIYDKIARKRGIIIRRTEMNSIEDALSKDSSFTDREIELEEFLDEGAENSGIKVVRFCKMEVEGDEWVDILTDYIHVLKGLPLRAPSKVCRACSKMTRRFCTSCKTSYCSKECENDDWVAHRSFCFKRIKLGTT